LIPWIISFLISWFPIPSILDFLFLIFLVIISWFLDFLIPRIPEFLNSWFLESLIPWFPDFLILGPGFWIQDSWWLTLDSWLLIHDYVCSTNNLYPGARLRTVSELKIRVTDPSWNAWTLKTLQAVTILHFQFL
jgi:hypothetical protein